MLMLDQATGQPVEILVPHFDPHMHGRLAAIRAALLREVSNRVCGGVFEPNTDPHLLTCSDVDRYVDECHEIAPDRQWSASIYLTPETSLQEVKKAWDAGVLVHVKSYPPHGTTNSSEGVGPDMLIDINSPAGKLVCGLADEGIPFKTHGEVVAWKGKGVHPQRRESLWYQEIQPHFDDLYRKRGLRQIHAHITTTEAAQHMLKNGDPDSHVCEITGHHLFDDWMLQYDGGYLLPDNHWLPVSKDETHTESIRGLVRKKLPFVHAGSDVAGHDTKRKYGQRAWGGGYTYHCSLELYVQVLEMLKVLDFAHDFLYGNAKRFHKDLVPDDPKPFRLVRENWTVGERTKYEGGEMTPFGFDEDLRKRTVFTWTIAS